MKIPYKLTFTIDSLDLELEVEGLGEVERPTDALDFLEVFSKAAEVVCKTLMVYAESEE